MIKSSADETQTSSQLPRSGPSKTISVSAQSGSDLTKQVQQAGKRSRGKKQEDLDLSAEKKVSIGKHPFHLYHRALSVKR